MNKALCLHEARYDGQGAADEGERSRSFRYGKQRIASLYLMVRESIREAEKELPGDPGILPWKPAEGLSCAAGRAEECRSAQRKNYTQRE